MDLKLGISWRHVLAKTKTLMGSFWKFMPRIISSILYKDYAWYCHTSDFKVRGRAWSHHHKNIPLSVPSVFVHVSINKGNSIQRSAPTYPKRRLQKSMSTVRNDQLYEIVSYWWCQPWWCQGVRVLDLCVWGKAYCHHKMWQAISQNDFRSYQVM